MNSEQAFMSLRSLELTDDEVMGVLARHATPRRRRVLAPALAFAAALLVGVVVPSTRAEMTDALRAVLHGGSLPGTAVPVSELPDWMNQVPMADGGEPRVIASVDGERMYVYRQQSGSLCFDLGGHVGVCDFTEQDLFADQPVAILGPTVAARSGRFHLWGLALASVKRVEATFADAPPVRVSVHGAFGVALDPESKPQELTVYDADGRELATLDLTERWQHRPTL
jgi:hypothetical protein